MKKLLIAILFCMLPTLAFAQSQRNPCFINSKGGCTPVGTSNPLPVTGGGGGGGGTSSNFNEAFPSSGTAVGALNSAGTDMVPLNLDNLGNLKVTGGSGGTSALDASAFTTGTTPIVPMGGLYNDAATLSSGQTGAPRLTTKRAQIIDTDTSGNALYSAITAPIPAGTNLIGKVGIDQTTPGMTNGVSVPPSSASSIGIVPVVSASTEGAHVLKASAGNLYGLTTTIGATTGWVMVFDATSAPADGAVTPKFCRYVKSDGTGGANSVAFNPPLVMTIGISVAFSSTGCFTKTASATAFFSGQVQ